jgi:hypothetical protein
MLLMNSKNYLPAKKFAGGKQAFMPFSTRKVEFSVRSEFRFVFPFVFPKQFHPRNHKTKRNSAPRGKFRLVENGL